MSKRNYLEIDYSQLETKNVADILLVTATKTETEFLLDLFEDVCSEGLLEVKKDEKRYNLGVFGGYNVVHCQCTNMGTQEVGSSMLTTTNALRDWPNVKCVIMVGIAFGMYNEVDDIEKQSFGDVLVAKKIFPYENQRLNPSGDTKYRGIEHESDRNLLDAFTIVARDWNEINYNNEQTKIHIVPMLTGEKLVDNLTWRNDIKAKYSDYKGGEMEGMGIASASTDAGKPWILVKSICDFADGLKGSAPEDEELKERKQNSAAHLAAKACELALQTVNVKIVIGDKLNYFYRGNINNVDDILFIRYNKYRAPYYLNRKVDEDLKNRILRNHIWITGASGIGKSDLLRHALVESCVKFIYVDLSNCDKEKIDDMFYYIYECVAESYNEEAAVFKTHNDTINKLCSILESKADGNSVYIFVEEIPFDKNSEGFAEFVRRYAGLINYYSNHKEQSKTYFILSSIASPGKALDTYKDKIEDLVYFEELAPWTKEECIDLINLLSKAIGIVWENDEIKESFIEKFEFSPRKIKNALKECCSLGYREIDTEFYSKMKIR